MASSDDDPTSPDPMGHYIPDDDQDPDPLDESERWSPNTVGSINIGNPPKLVLRLIQLVVRLLLVILGAIRTVLQVTTVVLRRILAIVDRLLKDRGPRGDSQEFDPDRTDPPVG
jgi:hypothetical protein